MTRLRRALLAAAAVTLLALPAIAQETDGLPKSQEEDGLPKGQGDDGLPKGEGDDGLPKSGGGGSDCVCPKEGHWDMPNLEGSFKCKGAAMFNRKLKKHMKYGTTVMMSDDCTKFFGDGKKKKDEEGLMLRQDDCGYVGVILGEEQGVKVDFTVTWDVQTQEHITGVMAGAVNDRGFSCEVYRPFEMDWTKPLSEAEREKELKEGKAHEEWLMKQKEKQHGKG